MNNVDRPNNCPLSIEKIVNFLIYIYKENLW